MLKERRKAYGAQRKQAAAREQEQEVAAWMQHEVIIVLLCGVSRPQQICSQSREKWGEKVLR